MAVTRPEVGRSDKKRRTFACIYPDASNVHLVKDIGMIANVLARSHGYESHFVCLGRGRQFPYLDDQARWLKLHQVGDEPKYRQFQWPPKSVAGFVWRNARNIDVLQLFNHTRETMLLALIYKLRRPKGHLYLKLDANEPWLAQELERKRSSRWLAFRDYLLPHLFVRWLPDLITAETNGSLGLFNQLYPWGRDRMQVLPNGVDDFWLERESLLDIRAEDKTDLVLVVGRIGTQQKNTELLLEALEGQQFGSWTVALAGPVDPGFAPKLEAFFVQRPDLRDRVVFLGEIRDRKELYGWYRKAKVFCMTSRWEGFSLALVDALHFGCHIVSTKVSSIDEILANGAHGRVVESKSELEEEFRAIFSGKVDPLAKFAIVREHSTGFRWSRLCAKLATWLPA